MSGSGGGGVFDRIAHYELLSVLGEGGAGRVYLAEDTMLGRRVALKVISMRNVEPGQWEKWMLRFSREATIHASLAHPSIACLLDHGSVEGQDGAQMPYIVLEYVDGRPIDDYVTSHRSPTAAVTAACSVLTAAAEAVDYAHTQGVVHRDLKPHNIMVTSTGLAKVTDFGISKLVGADITSASTTMGTPFYLAPEQAREGITTAKSDVFALAVVAYEILGSVRPFDANSIEGLLRQIVFEPPHPPLDDVLSARGIDHAQWDALFARALAKDPDERFPTASEFTSALTLACDPTSRMGTVLSGPDTVIEFKRGIAAELERMRLEAPRDTYQPDYDAYESEPEHDQTVVDDAPAISTTPTRVTRHPPAAGRRQQREPVPVTRYALIVGGVILALVGYRLVGTRLPPQPTTPPTFEIPTSTTTTTTGNDPTSQAAATPAPSTESAVDTIQVDSTPQGARIAINGVPTEYSTPHTVALPIAVQAEGVEISVSAPCAHPAAIRIGPDHPPSITLTLQPMSTTTTLVTHPDGATVIVDDGAPVGAPARVDLPCGRTRKVRVEMPGHRPATMTLDPATTQSITEVTLRSAGTGVVEILAAGGHRYTIRIEDSDGVQIYSGQPSTVSVPSGRCTVYYTSQSCTGFTGSITIAVANGGMLPLPLPLPSRIGRLLAVPEGAVITIDGETRARLIDVCLQPGKHVMAAEWPDGRRVTRMVTLSNGEVLPQVRLERGGS